MKTVRKPANVTWLRTTAIACIFALGAMAASAQKAYYTEWLTGPDPRLGSYTSCCSSNGSNVAGAVQGADGKYRAARWNVFRQVTLLDTWTTYGSVAMATDKIGQTAGYFILDAAGNPRAALFTGTSIVELGSLGGGIGAALGMDETGQVVGWSYTYQGVQHAFLYKNGVMKDLGTLGGSMSMAYKISSNGDIVGRSTTAGNKATHAFRYRNGKMYDLGTLGGVDSHAGSVNNFGDVVGWSITSAGKKAACLWPAAGGVVNLDPYGIGSTGSMIMDGVHGTFDGLIVGQALFPGTANAHPFVCRVNAFNAFPMTDLNTMVYRGWGEELIYASSVESGCIYGWGYRSGIMSGFRLSQVYPTISSAPASLHSGQSGIVTVTFSGLIPPSATTMTTQTSGPLVTSASTINLRQGDNTVSFSITAKAVAQSQSATITVMYDGSSRTQAVQVNP